MLPSLSSAVFAVELLLLLGGLALLWRHVLRPQARRQPALLSTWNVTLSDFFLFIWLVILGGLAGQYSISHWFKSHPLDDAHRLILGTTAFHAGMLLGMGVYRLCFSRSQSRLQLALPGALSSGLATFLITLPIITAVSLVWQLVLKLFHITPTPQDSIELLLHTDSNVLRGVLLATAVLVAPLTEELIFRAGIFRFVRTRLPRWIALLLPALLFALLHLDIGSFVPLVALAIIFSLAYERTGNIGTTIVAHALFNLNSAVLALAGMSS